MIDHIDPFELLVIAKIGEISLESRQKVLRFLDERTMNFWNAHDASYVYRLQPYSKSYGEYDNVDLVHNNAGLGKLIKECSKNFPALLFIANSFSKEMLFTTVYNCGFEEEKPWEVVAAIDSFTIAEEGLEKRHMIQNKIQQAISHSYRTSQGFFIKRKKFEIPEGFKLPVPVIQKMQVIIEKAQILASLESFTDYDSPEQLEALFEMVETCVKSYNDAILHLKANLNLETIEQRKKEMQEP